MKRTFKLSSITFKPGNDITYGQDFLLHKGCPSGIKFSAEYINDSRVKLTAPGYGMSSDYGKGAIYVSVRDI